MAADHRRKRLNGASFAGCSSREQYKAKKKKLESLKNDFNVRSHISLEWDANSKKVAAKREQVGLCWKDLRAFNNPSPQRHGILADVLVVPQEIFETENLMEVLSHEVWQTHLSESERKYLLQFLPQESDAEDTIQTLLSGDNFHFGNPLLKWSTSLCSGNLHPDALIHQEQRRKAEQRTYYSEIDKYHNEMIKYLKQLKEICETSEDSVNEVLLKISRSNRDVEQKISSHAHELGFQEYGVDAATTSESCSFTAEDKVCSSDYQNNSIMKGGKVLRRVHEKSLKKGKNRQQLLVSDDVKDRKGEKLHKRSSPLIEGNKYMSFLKISKKQHQLVKSMKHSGKSIQSKSLNRVLGNFDELHVHPFEEFVKEEQKNLHEHWLQLANVDLPAAHETWRDSQSQRKEIIRSLEQDLKNKLETSMEDEQILDDDTVSQDQHGGARKPEVEDEEKVGCEHILQYQNNQGESDGDSDEPNQDEDLLGNEDALEDPSDLAKREFDSNFQDDEIGHHDIFLLGDQKHGPGVNKESYIENYEESGSGALQNQSPQLISSPCGGPEINPADADIESNHIASKSDEISPAISGYPGNANTVNASMAQGGPSPSGQDVWPKVGMPHSFYGSTAHGYASTGLLSLPHSVDNDQQSHLIDFESATCREAPAKSLLQRQANGGSFSSFPSHDRSGLLQSLFKGQDTVSYRHQQKQTGLNLQTHNMLIQNGHFPINLQRQQLHPSLPLEQTQKRNNDNFVQPSLSGDIYSEGGPYLVPRHLPTPNGHLPPVNLADWPLNTARLPAHLNNEVMLSQNWYSGDHQVHGGWNDSVNASLPGQSVGSNTDQGLYSVLSQCNQLQSNNRFGMAPPEQFMLPGSYQVASGVTSRMNNSIPQANHSLDYLSRRDPSGSLLPDDNMGWMNLPQNASMQDPVGKSYLRSWDQ